MSKSFFDFVQRQKLRFMNFSPLSSPSAPASAMPASSLEAKKNCTFNVLVVDDDDVNIAPFLARSLQVECPDLLESKSAGISAVEGMGVSKQLQRYAAHVAVDTSDHEAQRMNQELETEADVILVTDTSILRAISSVFHRTETVFLITEFLPEDFSVDIGGKTIRKGSDVPIFYEENQIKELFELLQYITAKFGSFLRELHFVHLAEQLAAAEQKAEEQSRQRSKLVALTTSMNKMQKDVMALIKKKKTTKR